MCLGELSGLPGWTMDPTHRKLHPLHLALAPQQVAGGPLRAWLRLPSLRSLATGLWRRELRARPPGSSWAPASGPAAGPSGAAMLPQRTIGASMRCWGAQQPCKLLRRPSFGSSSRFSVPAARLQTRELRLACIPKAAAQAQDDALLPVPAAAAPPPPASGKDSAATAAATLVNVAVGAGILSMPYSFSLMGWSLGLFFTRECCAATGYGPVRQHVPALCPRNDLRCRNAVQWRWLLWRRLRCACCVPMPRSQLPPPTLAWCVASAPGLLLQRFEASAQH